MTDSLSAPAALRQDASVIALVGVAHAVSHFFHLILAPLFPWLKVAFSLSYAQLGLLMTVFFVVSGTGQTVAGFVVDRIGARRVLAGGLLLLALAAMVLANAASYPLLLAGSMLAGLGNGVFHPADFTLLNQHVRTHNLGHAFSVHGIAGNLGWACAPVFLTALATLFGWRVALACAATLPLAVLLLLLRYRATLADAPRHAAGPAHAAPGAAGLLDFLRLRAVWMCFAFFFITALASAGIQSFAVSGLRQLYGMSLTLATTAFTLYMLASAAGMLAGGFLAARTQEHDRTIALAFALAGLFAFVLAGNWVGSAPALLCMGAIGFGSGIAGPSRDLMIRAAAPRNATGRVYGVVYAGLDIGLAGGPLLFGAMMDGGHPAWLFAAIGVFLMMAILTAIGVGAGTRATRTQPA